MTSATAPPRRSTRKPAASRSAARTISSMPPSVGISTTEARTRTSSATVSKGPACGFSVPAARMRAVVGSAIARSLAAR